MRQSWPSSSPVLRLRPVGLALRGAVLLPKGEGHVLQFSANMGKGGYRPPLQMNSLVDDAAANQSHHRFYLLDLIGWNRQVVAIEHEQVRQLARLD